MEVITQEKQKVNGRLFQKGVSGNPNGRPPKGYSITEMMKDMLNKSPEKKLALGKVIYKKALEGDITAIKTLWQYMDGMPVTKAEVLFTQLSDAELDRQIAIAAATLGEETISGLISGESQEEDGEPD